MDKPIIFMYSGQGSHYYHMGKELYEKHQGFRRWMIKLDEIACAVLGKSIIDIIYNESKTKADAFNRTIETSPAIIMVEYALTQVLLEDGIKPDYLLGASLGEVTAALISNKEGVKQILEDLKRRLTLFEKKCCKGTMIGILENPDIYRQCSVLHANSDIAAKNFYSHFVISCAEHKVDVIKGFLNSNNIKYQVLPVSLGFHSSMLEPIELEFKDLFKHRQYAPPRTPLISCTNAKQVDSLDTNYFWNVFRKPILFQDTIQELERKQNYIYIDLGPSGTLSNFVKYNLSDDTESLAIPILTPFGDDLKNLEKVRKMLIPSQPKEKKVITYMFPGQGSQFKSMGRSLFDNFKDPIKKSPTSTHNSLIKRSEKLQDRINEWNKTYPVGTKVNVNGYDDIQTTRTEAIALFGHRATIYLEGFNGYFSLDEITPLSTDCVTLKRSKEVFK